jgi:hypothetical protein
MTLTKVLTRSGGDVTEPSVVVVALSRNRLG